MIFHIHKVGNEYLVISTWVEQYQTNAGVLSIDRNEVIGLNPVCSNRDMDILSGIIYSIRTNKDKLIFSR